MKDHNSKLNNYILGLDIGVNSIGWAVVECKPIKTTYTSKGETKQSTQYDPVQIVALNSRIFQEMVEAKTSEPKNKARRTARGMRRRLARLKGRREALLDYLQKQKLLPKEVDEDICNDIDQQFAKRIVQGSRAQNRLTKLGWEADERQLASPFFMRAYGLDYELQPYEFGRVLLQLQKRRGYKSNSGAKYDALREELKLGDWEADTDEKETQSHGENEDKEAKEEKKQVLAGIGHLQKAMQDTNSRTLGEYICKRACKEQQRARRITQYSVVNEKETKEKEKIEIENTLYADRKLYKQEFVALWGKQAPLLNLSDKKRAEIEGILFYQRPLLNPPPHKKRWKHLRYNDVGNCSFLPKKQRAPKALLESQDYRTYACINNIYLGKGKDQKGLTQEQRQLLYEKANDSAEVNKSGRLTWANVKKILGQGINYESAADEESQKNAKSGLVGNLTAMSIKKIIGNKWDSLEEAKQKQLVNDLLYVQDKVKLYERLEKYWGFGDGAHGEAHRLAELELEPGHMRHCKKVIVSLLDRMKQEGEDYARACEQLGYGTKQNYKLSKDSIETSDIPSIANPRVQKSLYEIRRVVNAVLKKYGKLSVIRLEMARELKQSKKHRAETQKIQVQNRKLNQEADYELRAVRRSERIYGSLAQSNAGYHYNSKDDIHKYKLWKEQNAQCLYCGQPISGNELLQNAQVDHILPQSAFAQNYLNTVIACQTCNQEKGGRTPYQTWGSDLDRWSQIEKRVKNLKLHKKKEERLLTDKDDFLDEEGFVESQLNDTRYIAVAAKNYLQVIGVPIEVTKGGATAKLREYWGLDKVLPAHPEEKINLELIEERTGEVIEEKQVSVKEIKRFEKKKDTLSIAKYDLKQAEQAKNRRDHRHHAVDAFTVAMTDRSNLIGLTKLNRLYRNQKTDESEEIKKIKDKLRLPKHWKSDNDVLRKDLKSLLDKAIVSHEAKHKVWGALHEDTIYGKSFYISEMPLATDANTWKRIEKYLHTDREGQGDITWVLREKEREVLADWIEQQSSRKPKERTLPFLDGKPLTQIKLAHRCYVVRKPLNEELIKSLKGDWQEGKGKWIKDRTVYEVLQQWLQKHGEKNIKADLQKDPPRMPNKRHPERSHPIRSVRLAQKKGSQSVTEVRPGQVCDLGSNHHMELFISGEGEKQKKKGRVVSMKEAAERKSRKQAIIDREPSSEWGEGWKFWMSLQVNDLVEWEADKLAAEKQDHKDLGPLVYRVQKMVVDGTTVFRHHSLATSSDSDHHGKIQASPNTCYCRKLKVDALGNRQD